MAKSSKSFYTGVVKKSVIIKKPKDRVWRKISNIIGLPTWIDDVKETIFLSKTKRGIGSIRKLTFTDGNQIEEHVVGWNNGKYFSYIAVSGLPLRAYHATLSVTQLGRHKTKLTWQSYFNSKAMTKKEFNDFVLYLGKFYQQSLNNLKKSLEK